MKSSRRVLLITATVLVLLGAALMLCAFVFAGGDMKELSTDRRDWIHSSYELSEGEWEGLTMISCSDGAESVYVEGYDGDVLRVEYWEHQQRDVDVQQDGTELHIFGNTRDDPFRLGLYIGAFEDHSTRVLVPREYAGSLYVSSAAGRVSVTNVSAADVSIQSEDDLAIANNLEVQKLRVTSNNGDIQCNTVDVAGDLLASSENGAIDIAGALAENIGSESENGAVSIDASFARDMLFAASSNGDVSVFSIDALKIEVSTDDGAARVALPGCIDDYDADASSESGYVNAPTSSSGDASRKVTVRTQSGELLVNYEGSDLDALVKHNIDSLRSR